MKRKKLNIHIIQFVGLIIIFTLVFVLFHISTGNVKHEGSNSYTLKKLDDIEIIGRAEPAKIVNTKIVNKKQLLISSGQHVYKGQKLDKNGKIASISGIFYRTSEGFRIASDDTMVVSEVDEFNLDYVKKNAFYKAKLVANTSDVVKLALSSISLTPDGNSNVSGYRAVFLSNNHLTNGKHVEISIPREMVFVPKKYIRGNTVRVKKGHQWKSINVFIHKINNQDFVSKSQLKPGEKVKKW
ncbi:hypothetical protein A7K95_06330 [Pediococcus parvulus]|uniref:Uncharacterized protein n=1 Tax=Pediococcus parvulus TaxID=54062 RepID=A0AAP5TDD0_9LACO|nr:efflux RND transporter periplasmic adaptor subunit [Pediococcus parvulus]MDN5575678.1 efflux RND transporter periplasmic adaptor subunit [Pediococcus sp.]MDV7694541.1 hypothetical protein [Pediococcus parvulus]OAD64129.1 hypothetical protein A7K95_06330 [Pediococcus parvulus]